MLALQTTSRMVRTARLILAALVATRQVAAFKTGLEDGLICNVCVGTHPGCGERDFDPRWYWGKMCPR